MPERAERRRGQFLGVTAVAQQLTSLPGGDHIIHPREHDPVGQHARDQLLDHAAPLCAAQLAED